MLWQLLSSSSSSRQSGKGAAAKAKKYFLWGVASAGHHPGRSLLFSPLRCPLTPSHSPLPPAPPPPPHSLQQPSFVPLLRPTPLGKKGRIGRVTLTKRGPKKVDQTDPPACVILYAGWGEHCWMALLRVEEATELASAPLMLKKCFCLFSSPMHNLSFVKAPMEKTFVFFASFANCSFLLPLLPSSCPGVAFPPPPLVPIFFACALSRAPEGENTAAEKATSICGHTKRLTRKQRISLTLFTLPGKLAFEFRAKLDPKKR